LQAQTRLKNKVGAAMMYPMIMVIVGVIVVAILMTMVVPRVTQLIKGRGQELPLPTEILITCSDFLVDYWLLVMVGILCLVVAFQLFVNSVKGRLAFDSFKLKLPIFGDLAKKQAMARFSITLATLLRSGVPALQALQVTKKVLDNVVLQNALQTVHDRVLEGTDISTPMKMSGVFPATISYMVGVGEQAGNLEEMLERIAATYDEEVDLATQKLTSIIEPVIIVMLAVVVAGIVIAIVLPLLQLQRTG
jgi:type II secretory pathway component PulF